MTLHIRPLMTPHIDAHPYTHPYTHPCGYHTLTMSMCTHMCGFQLDTDGSGEIDYEEYMRFVLKETLQRKARVTMCVPSSMLSRCHLPAASR